MQIITKYEQGEYNTNKVQKYIFLVALLMEIKDCIDNSIFAKHVQCIINYIV